LPWSTASGAGALVEIVTQGAITPHGGTHALHVRLAPSSDGTSSRQAAMYHTFAASPYTSGELYARAWFQVPASNLDIVSDHVDLFSFGNTSHFGEEVTLYLQGQGSGGQVDGWVDPIGSQTETTGMTILPFSPMMIPTGSWFCLALHVTIAPDGPMEFGLDQMHSGLQPAQTKLNDGIDEIGVGLEFLDPSSTGNPELYVDDVAVGTSPLSCP
jgi:hypothetical protein